MEKRCTGLVLVLAGVVACFLSPTRAFHDSYDGYKLLSIHAATREDLNYLAKMETFSPELDFWNGRVLDHNTTLLTPPSLLDDVKHNLTKHDIAWTQLDLNVSKILEDGMRRTETESTHFFARAQKTSIIDHENYHSYRQMVFYLKELERSYPDNAEFQTLTYYTHERRAVAAIKLMGGESVKEKPAIIVEAGIHAREWISPAATLYTIEKMLDKYKFGDNTAKYMLDSYDWYFVPITNPDGYEFTRQSTYNRLWRKNRRVGFFCYGVDLNRNFDVYFGTTGVSKDCDSSIYPGESAFSEPESANIRELFNGLKKSVVAYVSVHSYSQLLLVPWAYSSTGAVPKNSEEIRRVANKMADAIQETDGRVYRVGSTVELINYAASGSSMDWALMRKPGIYAVAYELRPDPNDPRGFNLPASEIVPTGQELFASLSAMATEMKLPSQDF